MKKDNSQTRWERKQRKELLQREQDASNYTWYDKMNFFVRDFSFGKTLSNFIKTTKENYTGEEKK